MIQTNEWALVSEFFASVTRWAASNETEMLGALREKLLHLSSSDEEMEHLKVALRLYGRLAKGEDVREEAQNAVFAGVSRAFLALILLGPNPDCNKGDFPSR